MRGSLAHVCERRRYPGSIPACAGEPSTRCSAGARRRVYPRVCGGSRDEGRRGVRAGGSIPACAGEPVVGSVIVILPRVYPRVCGGASSRGREPGHRLGLSPRVRGSLVKGAGTRASAGSIPACAGSRGQPERSESNLGSIPACAGGAWPASIPHVLGAGLSPRVRGSRTTGQWAQVRCRSIPACAGEPRRHRLPRQSSRVYPRVCGGAAYLHDVIEDTPGLSPRVRGSPARPISRRPLSRSIPACAGEPNAGTMGTARLGVYPRVCGGALLLRRSPRSFRGLSPRVRGSRLVAVGAVAGTGSIPACAGEPRGGCWPSAWWRVYPRVCGGAGSRMHDAIIS